MIVSPSLRLVFIHLPKTGGTAFTHAFEHGAQDDDLIFSDSPDARRRQAAFNRGRARSHRLSKHATLADLARALPDFPLSEARVVTILRNPWDRLVSFHAWARAQRFDHPMVTAARAPFAAFLRDPRVTGPLRAHPSPSYWTAPGAPPPTILRFETLATDAAALGIGLPPLPRVNVSDRPADWRPFYTDEDAARVPALFRFEVEKLGYGFDLWRFPRYPHHGDRHFRVYHPKTAANEE